MPDIVSKIRVEAVGADQAAREIRKLKDAYTEVAAAAKGISPESAGGDAFAKAVNPPGGGTGPGSNEDIVQRESRSKAYREQVREREMNNVVGAGGVNRGISTAEAVSSGRGGAMVGNAASGLAAMGIGGVGLLAGAAVAMGAQKFADNAFGRMENIYGTGMSQRLGREFSDIEALQIEYGRKGIPLGMVQSMMGAGSQSGLSMNKRGALPGMNWAMEAMRDLGVDAGTTGGLMGALSRSDMDMSRLDYEFFAQSSNAFGRENTTRYLQEMARGIETMSSQGIRLTEETLTKQTNLLSGLGVYGDMTPEGAAALNQAIQAKGVMAAQLNRPEDIIAFQAMRKEGESVTDTMMRMERDPAGTAMAQYKYLKSATGEDKDAMRILLSKSLGVSVSSADAFMSTMSQMQGKDDNEIRAELDKLGAGWQGKTRGAEGEWEYKDPAAQTYAIKQSQMLAGVEKAMLELTTGLTKFFREILGNEINMDTSGINWMNIYKETRAPFDPGNVLETAEELKTDPTKMDYFSSMADKAGIGSIYEDLKTGTSGGVGNWNDVTDMIAAGLAMRAQDYAKENMTKDERDAVNQKVGVDVQLLMDTLQTTSEESKTAINNLIEELRQLGVVFTD